MLDNVLHDALEVRLVLRVRGGGGGVESTVCSSVLASRLGERELDGGAGARAHQIVEIEADELVRLVHARDLVELEDARADAYVGLVRQTRLVHADDAMIADGKRVASLVESNAERRRCCFVDTRRRRRRRRCRVFGEECERVLLVVHLLHDLRKGRLVVVQLHLELIVAHELDELDEADSTIVLHV